MLKRIKIKGFRSLDVDVELGPINVLIGQSGSGKSNFVEALRFLRNVLKATDGSWATTAAGQGYFKFPRDRQPIELEIEASIPGIADAVSYRLVFDDHSVREESLEVDGAVVLQTDEQISRVRLVSDSQSFVAARETPAITQGHGVRELHLICNAFANKIGCYDFPSQVLTGESTEVDTGFDDAGRNFIQTARHIYNAVDSNNWSCVRCLFPVIGGPPYQSAIRVKEANFESIEIQHRLAGDKTIALPLERESEGYRRFLALLLALYQVPSKHLLVFDEPEKGLYPGALETLATEFHRCTEQGRGQVIVTTHSPEFLEHFAPDTIQLVELQDGVTRIGKLASEQIEVLKEHLLFPSELFLVDPARMEQGQTVNAE